MGRKSTEIPTQLSNDKINAIYNYVQRNGYEKTAVDNYETWVKPCLPVWGQINNNYYYIQFHEVGDKLVVDEWVTNYMRMQMNPTNVFATLNSLGFNLIHHKNLMDYLKSI